ncbi:Deleted in malignant brain tumors 1 protein, partial [Eudyptula minor novaehollandiae]
CARRVEVKHEGQWGTVCGISWDMADAAVVCKQLGCGSALEAPEYGHFGPGSGPIWMFVVHCHGNECALSNCKKTEEFQQCCHHSLDAEVTCSARVLVHPLSSFSFPEFTGFWLVNGSTACEGRVEARVLGSWDSLCASHWDLLDAHVLCRHLDCG